ncbi:hypothetical protein [Aquidulcibacter paucihalophilus]|uniref:hypothetical protein n=1 Tax=Aquidulcibacter paucihalophilus TaxID=1978549 RepID=UPI000A191BD3|nr:hypothetical protein [Aquidulcibacter paucihalophilus]
MRQLWRLSKIGSCPTLATFDLFWGRKLVDSVNRRPEWLRISALVVTCIVGLAASYLCEMVITGAPLLLTLAQSASLLPFWICVFWPSFALSKDSLHRMSISGFLWRLALALQIVGFFALSLASDIYRGVAAELKLRDTTAASQELIQAMHEQAAELTSLALTWAGYSLAFWVFALIVYGVIWIWRSFREIAAIKESPKLNKDEIFIVGDRG